MSGVYNNELRGILFRNERKRTASFPDWSGNCEIDGIAYFIDAWDHHGKNDAPFLSLRFKKKMTQQNLEREAMPQQRPQPSQPKADFDDEIPF